MAGTYRYSPKEAEEAKRIRAEFSREEPSDMEKLRKIRNEARRKALVPTIVYTVISVLIFGSGFSLIMRSSFFVQGVVIGIIGLLMTAFAYPLYRRLLEREKQKREKEVEELADRIING